MVKRCLGALALKVSCEAWRCAACSGVACEGHVLAHSLRVRCPRSERCAAKWRGLSVLAAVVREKACLPALRALKTQ